MSVMPVLPKGSPPPLAPYSPGAMVRNPVRVIHTAGMLGLDKEGKLVGAGDVAAQTRQTLENIKAVIEAAGGTMADIAFNLIFLKDMADYAKMNAVYGEYFPKNPPGRACVRADLVKPEFLVEIAATAYLTK
ncbi:MAG: pyrimidine utilization protein C [Proteobacteria bacterium]|nr:pyrimidine utilization protein C [Pseudomonadota bacterium]